MKPTDFLITRLSSINSTQDFVRQKVREKGFPQNGVVIADIQTQGKGRNGNKWVSENNKGLWMTLYVTDSDSNPFDAVIRASLSIVDTFAHYLLDASIKWPNDLLVKRKKICGILTEAIDDTLLIGIGVNLRQRESDFPQPLLETATSLFIEKSMEVDNNTFLDLMLELFCKFDKPEENFSMYTQKLGILGSSMSINGMNIMVKGVERDGALKGQLKDKSEKLFYSGSLSWI